MSTNALNVDLSLIVENKLITGPWNKSYLQKVNKNGCRVLSTFSCGGGSSFGYKLAGFDVIGCVEIDPKIYEVYLANHDVKYPFNTDIREFRTREDLPGEFSNLDILDGSPPCSSFSMAGSREKGWGKEKKFREGQANQVLDDLFFEFIALTKRLQPKVAIAENVKGLIQGHARGYVKQIFQGFKEAGYTCQLFLLNAAAMGVPQRRERTFFIANRLGKKIDLKFDEPAISVEKALGGSCAIGKSRETKETVFLWAKTKIGDTFASVHPKGNYFTWRKVDPKSSAPCNIGSSHTLFHWNICSQLNSNYFKRTQSFPDDYNFLDQKAGYVCGMSVPPLMMQRLADQVYRQLLI